ncbi:MAG: PRC-barrel domain-containing protein [Anaerolineaceae bacterium]|nr:PRC-barrel domain-containing protein [Anaerolineaceae bacterium]
MFDSSKWKKLGIVMVLLLLVGALVACGGDENEPGTNDNTVTIPDEDVEGGGGGLDDDVLPTTIPNEPTITPMVEETEVMEPTIMPTEVMEETVEPTVEVEPTAEMTATVEMTDTEGIGPMDQPTIVRGSDLIGAELVNAADEEVAEVQEILFDANGDIQYVILSIDELTDDFPYYAVAWDTLALSFDQDQDEATPDVFVYEGDTIDVEGALGLDEAMLETEDLFYETAEDAGTDTAMLDGLYQLSAFADFSLFDYDLVNPDTDDDLGEIEDLLVNVDENRISYAVADVGGFLGIAETAVAIPWERVSFDEAEENFTIDADEEDLANAPSIDMSDIENWQIDTEWEQELDAYWNDLTN